MDGCQLFLGWAVLAQVELYNLLAGPEVSLPWLGLLPATQARDGLRGEAGQYLVDAEHSSFRFPEGWTMETHDAHTLSCHADVPTE